MARLALCLPHLSVPGAFAHAPICKQTQQLVAELIQDDAEHHHVYFNHKSFHNHLIHQLLADYSLGADEKRLKELYKKEAKIQRPKEPEKEDFKWDDKKCLGNENYYSNYLKHFLLEVEAKGPIACAEEYLFKQNDSADMFNRFVVGFYHPIIHLGYGLEFDIPMMVAEGLAQTAIHSPNFKVVFPNGPPKQTEQKGTFKTALELVKEAQKDKRFEGHTSFKEQGKLYHMANRATDVIREYMGKWHVSEELDGKDGLRARAIELQAAAAVICTATQNPEKQVQIDFFLMHILTSSHFMPVYVEQLKPANAAALLRAKFAADLTLYTSYHCAPFNMEQFKMHSNKSWDEIIAAAVAHDDVHLPKAVRSIKHAADVDKSIDAITYKAMAQMLLEGDGHWNQNSVGFKEAWDDVPDRGTAAAPYVQHSTLKEDKHEHF